MPYLGNEPTAIPLSSADLLDGIITSAKIADGTIVNADINASAGIASTKLSGVGFTSGTAVATTSGTAFDFTGIPASTKIIILNLHEISLSGGDNLYVQLGDSGGFETSGYLSTSAYTGASSSYTSATDAFTIVGSSNTAVFSGLCFISLVDSSTNTWVSNHTGKHASNYVIWGGGSKSLSSTLTQVRLTRGGTDTFDNGKLNILYI